MNKKRIIATALSALTLVASMGGLTACGGDGAGNSASGGGNNKYVYNVPGENKLTIKIKNFGGGPGNVWLEEAAERFAQEKQVYSHSLSTISASEFIYNSPLS